MAGLDASLLLLAWSGADLQRALRLVDEGRMPAFASLVDNGLIGGLPAPPLHPVSALADIVTGQAPTAHGVWQAGSLRPDGGGVEPAGREQLRARPLWELADRQGIGCFAANWPLTHPAQRLAHGLLLSDRFARPMSRAPANRPVPPESLSDPACSETLQDLLVHPGEIVAEQLEFLLAGTGLEPATRSLEQLLRDSLARAATVHAAGTWAVEQRRWPLVAVCFDLLEALWLGLPGVLPRRLAEPDSAKARDSVVAVVERAMQILDLFLARYLGLADRGTAVWVISTHGFMLVDGRVMAARRGLLAAAGPGIQRDDLLFGLHPLDVVPTALARLGARVPACLPGRVEPRLAAKRPVRADPGPLPEPAACDRPLLDVAAAHAQLDRLGYPRHDPSPAIRREAAEWRLQGAIAAADWFLEHGQPDAALQALTQADGDGASLELLRRRVLCHLRLNQAEQARALLAAWPAAGEAGAAWYCLFRGMLAAADGLPDEAQSHLRRCLSGCDANQLDCLLALAEHALQAGDWSLAEQACRRLTEWAATNHRGWLGLGRALLGQQRFADARRALARCIEEEPALAEAFHYLQQACAGDGDPQAAAAARRRYEALSRLARSDRRVRLRVPAKRG